jgi:hypothetical protein
VGKLRGFVWSLAFSTAAISNASGADIPLGGGPPVYPVLSPRPLAQWEVEVGGRYWFSTGRTKLNLFGFLPGSDEISRLTYSGLQAHSGEMFGGASTSAGSSSRHNLECHPRRRKRGNGVSLPGWRISGIWLGCPYASLSATDIHWLRTDLGPRALVSSSSVSRLLRLPSLRCS